jgi:hypothetical protein
VAVDFVSLFAADAEVSSDPSRRRFNRITYRPELNIITGDPLASILLGRIVFWWSHVGRRPFYKFFAPCKHKLYKPGDSWQEELGLSRWQIDSALEKIATKIKQGASRADVFAGVTAPNLVLFYTVGSRETYYEVNEPLFNKLTEPIYTYSGKPQYIPNAGLPQREGEANAAGSQQSSNDGSPQNITNSSFTHTDNSTHTHESRRGGKPQRRVGLTRHPHDLVRHYFDLLAADPREGIENVSKLVTARIKDGLADADIDEWLRRREPATQVETAEVEQQELLRFEPPAQVDPFARSLWAGDVEKIAEAMPAQTFQAWIAPLVAVSADDDELVLWAPNEIVIEWVDAQYKELINSAIMPRVYRWWYAPASDNDEDSGRES